MQYLRRWRPSMLHSTVILTLWALSLLEELTATLHCLIKNKGINQKFSLLRKGQWPAFGHALAVQRDLLVCSKWSGRSAWKWDLIAHTYYSWSPSGPFAPAPA